MEVNVKVTVDLGDKTMSLFSGLMAANQAVAKAVDTTDKVLKKYADEPTDDEPEPEKPTRTRRSRKATDEAEAPKRSRKAAEPEDEPDDNDDARPEPAARSKRSTEVTHDDIRDLMSEVIEDDEDNRPKVLKQLNKIGAKSVGTIKEDDLADFFDFLQSLKAA